MLKVVFLLISKLDGPPSTFVPPNAAENRDMPLKSYVFATLCRRYQVRPRNHRVAPIDISRTMSEYGTVPYGTAKMRCGTITSLPAFRAGSQQRAKGALRGWEIVSTRRGISWRRPRFKL